MSKVKDENYFQISGWMVNNLKLQGNELMLFAIIYCFSQEENSRFTGSINYLCDFINCSRTTVINTLKKLENKNYIIKTQKVINSVKFNEYSVNLPLVQNLNMGSTESVHGVVQNLYGGSTDSAPNNKYINNIDNKDKYNARFEEFWENYPRKKEKEAIKWSAHCDSGIPTVNQDAHQVDTQVRLGKDSLGKVKKYSVHFEEFWKNYPRKKEKARAYKCYQARLNDGYSEEELLTACKNYARECEKEKTEQRYIKHGSTFLSDSMPFLDYLKMERELTYAEANNIDTLDDIWPD